jgi:hypothetical protein
MRRTIAWAALVAWLGASGLSWDLLQVVAWVKMSAENARSMDVSSAVSKTLNDAPCSLCCAVKAGRESSESDAPLAKQEQAKSKEKAQGSLWAASEAPEPIHGFAGLVPIPFRSHKGPLCEVPVPPPKSAA